MSTWPDREVTLSDGRAVLVRCVRESDAAAFLRYARESNATSEFAVTLPDEFPLSVEKELAMIRECLESPVKLLLVAEVVGAEDGRIIADVSFRGHPRRRMAHHGHFGIGVVEEYRGKGLGRAMILMMLDWARAHPTIEKVCLGVVAANHRAVRLYESMGFVEECRRDREFKFGPDHYEDDIQMSLWLGKSKTGSPES